MLMLGTQIFWSANVSLQTSYLGIGQDPVRYMEDQWSSGVRNELNWAWRESTQSTEPTAEFLNHTQAV